MILTCSLCETRYLVQAALFEGGPRMVRCARCQNTWLARDSENQAPQRVSADPALAAVLSETAPLVLEKPVSPRMKRVKLILKVIGILLVLTWLVFDRQEIAKNRPHIEKIYNALGLVIYHYGGEGLSFEEVRSELRFEGGIMKLAIEGKIHNDMRYTERVPDILATAVGSNGQPLLSWRIDAPIFKLSPGELVRFQSSVNAPKGTVVDMNLSFIEIKDPHE